MNSFAKECATNNISLACVTGSTPNEVDALIKEINPTFEMYSADPTALKTIIRSNPGLILLKDGYVVDKWPYRKFPSYADFQSNITDYDAKLIKWKELSEYDKSLEKK